MYTKDDINKLRKYFHQFKQGAKLLYVTDNHIWFVKNAKLASSLINGKFFKEILADKNLTTFDISEVSNIYAYRRIKAINVDSDIITFHMDDDAVFSVKSNLVSSLFLASCTAKICKELGLVIHTTSMVWNTDVLGSIYIKDENYTDINCITYNGPTYNIFFNSYEINSNDGSIVIRFTRKR